MLFHRGHSQTNLQLTIFREPMAARLRSQGVYIHIFGHVGLYLHNPKSQITNVCQKGLDHLKALSYLLLHGQFLILQSLLVVVQLQK